MTNAYRDQNHIPVKLAVSNADGITTLPLQVDPAIHALLIDDGVGGAITTASEAERDENHVTTIMAVSSADGVTPIALAVDSVTGKLLINSN